MSAPTAGADAHDSPTLALTRELMQRPSVTPVDGGCQALMAERLTAIGFTCEHLRFGDVDNLWARRGTASPLLAFAGHTDVVPTGPEAEWRFDPFTPTVADGRLYGRGAADMKGSLAAMIVALERLHAQGVTLSGSVALLITSDEEGPAHDGTARVMEHLKRQGTNIDYCIVGEPSSTSAVGDVVRNGRRGSLNGALTVSGIQGHVAYPEQVNNPIHGLGAAIAALSTEVWDTGNEFFPPTSFQISNLHAGTGATNVVPGHADVLLNFRFSTAVTPADLRQRTEAILEQHLAPLGLQFKIDWQLSGSPFLTDSGDLLAATAKVIESRTNLRTQFSTSGGTSDGRFIAPTGTELIELGPCNATIHQVNECVMVEELEVLTDLYAGIVTELLR